MSRLHPELAVDSSDSPATNVSDRHPRFSRSLLWYAAIYVAGLLFANGLATAVHGVLHNVL